MCCVPTQPDKYLSYSLFLSNYLWQRLRSPSISLSFIFLRQRSNLLPSLVAMVSPISIPNIIPILSLLFKGKKLPTALPSFYVLRLMSVPKLIEIGLTITLCDESILALACEISILRDISNYRHIREIDWPVGLVVIGERPWLLSQSLWVWFPPRTNCAMHMSIFFWVWV